MKLIHTLKTSALLLTGALCLTGPALAQGVIFEDITHYPAGNATLTLAPGGSHLTVSNLGSQGNDGVISVLDSAVAWDAKLSIFGNELGDTLKLGAFSDGVRTAATRLELVSNGIKVNALFTGADSPSQYTLQVLLDGELVAEFPGQTETSSQTVGPLGGGPWQPPIEPIPCPMPMPWPWPDFKIEQLGNCSFGFDLGQPTVVTSSDGGTAVGDRIQLVENPPVGGHSLYVDFNGMKIQSNGDSLVIHEENEVSNGF